MSHALTCHPLPPRPPEDLDLEDGPGVPLHRRRLTFAP